MQRYAGILFLALTVSTSPGWAEAPEHLAARILKAVDRPVGLVHLPRSGDGALALALAACDQNLCLHGQDADGGQVRQARRLADQQGWLGRRVWLDQGDLTRLLPAARSADLVVLVDLKASELTPELAAEVRRVLHPWFGLAVVGDATGKLDPAALRAWAGAIAKKVTPLLGEGTLVTVQADPLPGADDWPMWWHGSDNNSVSADTAFQLPATMQWTGKPYFSPTRIEIPIVSGGRLFMLWNGYQMDMAAGTLTLAGPEGDGPVLTAQAVGSGVRLWVRRLSKAAWVQVSRSIMVGDSGRLLVGDGNVILDLDAATGQEIRRKPLDCPEIKWMALRDGRLFVLGGTVTENFGKRSDKAVAPFRSSGLNLIALDGKTLEPLWRVDRQAGQDAFDPRSPAIDGDRLFIAGEADTAESYSVEDGRLRWKVKVGFERARLGGYEWDFSSRHPVTGYAGQDVYVISGLEMKEAVVISQVDGKRLWTKPGGQFIPLAFWDLLWAGNSSLDPRTGKPRGKMKIGQYFIARDGDGRDFEIKDKVEVTGVVGADEELCRQLRLITAPTTWTVENLPPGSACTVRLHLFEPWLDKPGRRLMDVEVNNQSALKGFDVLAKAGGKNKALVQDLPAQTDASGRLTIRVSGTPGCPDPNPLLGGIEIRQESQTLVRFAASGPLVPVKGFKLIRSSCGRETMAPFLASTAYVPCENLKSSCGAGSYVADGLLWKFPTPCSCVEWRGFVVQAAQEKPLPPVERFYRGNGSAAVTAQDAKGWLTYRGNAPRSSASAAKIPAAAAIRWSAAPLHPVGTIAHPGQTLMEPELTPTPPLVADDRVIVAQADGAVEALDLKTGQRLWRALTSGRIQSSPTIWRDRVFAGSADGFLYAFALADGRELWRLRVAPEAGRIMVYGQLSSRWPILGAPLVADGKVVVSAGLIGMTDGVQAVCADAASGQVLWERRDWTASESGGKISGGGQFALGDELFYQGGMAPPIRISPADGACRPAFPATVGTRLGSGQVSKWRTIAALTPLWGGVKGQDIGVFSKDWIVYGGRRIWTDQVEGGAWGAATDKFLARAPDGQGRLPVVALQDSGLLPVWDEQDAAFICAKGLGKDLNLSGIVLIPLGKLQPALDALMAGQSTAEILAPDDQPPKNAVTVPPERLKKEFKANTEGLFSWRSAIDYGWQPWACVLTRNAVLVATARLDNNPKINMLAKLAALHRADGQKMWELNLPAPVVHDGLAVAPDGTVILTLVDGQTLCIGAGQK